MSVADTPESQSADELFLIHLRYKESQYVRAGGNQPILLTDPANSWVVYTGIVDVFVTPLDGNKPNGTRTHLFSVEAGQALFAVQPLAVDDNHFGLMAVGGRNASVLRIPTHRLQALAEDAEFRPAVIKFVDQWIRSLSTPLIDTLPPKESLKLRAGRQIALKKNESAGARRGIVWIKHTEGNSHFLGDSSLPVLNGKVYYPLSQQTWIESVGNGRLDIIDTHTLFEQARAWPDLQQFHHLVLTHLARQIQARQKRDAQLLDKSVASAQLAISGAFTRLATPLAGQQARSFARLDSKSSLMAACQIIGYYLGVSIEQPVKMGRDAALVDPLQEIVAASHLHTRRVALKDGWWRKDNGPLLAYFEDSTLGEESRPVALIPASPSRYEMHNPATQRSQRVTPIIAAKLGSFAEMFYRPLPTHALSVADIARFAWRDIRFDLRQLAWAGFVAGLLGLIVPVATGYLVSNVIPNAAQSQLFQLGFALIVVTIVTAFFQIVQNIAVLRLQDKWGAPLQAALWQRLLNLPVSFFRSYTAGDLGMRVMGINAIQQTLSGTVVGSLLAGIVSLVSFGLLYWLNVRLALIATGLVVVAVGATLAAGYAQVGYQRLLTDMEGSLAGLVLQTVTGIAKFRVAGAENRAFAAWAEDFGRSKQITYRARNVTNNLVVFNAGFSLLTTAVIFAVVASVGRDTFSTGTFLAFNAAFIQLLTAMLVLSRAIVSIMNIVPTYERLKPVMQTLPELDELKAHPGELNGRIEVSHVSFRYALDKPPVLKDISMVINPGEFVAVVGPSGSGKSTLLRLLLGFETPETGAVYYDNHDLSGLDIRAARRQIGVVLQDGKVMPGDIFHNIVGSSSLTLDDAWEAATMAGLDQDIRRMPMGMHTVITAGGGTLSGGQRQRLLIARAIVNKPRIIFFDEATSALDNATQTIVAESLDNLQATRVIIAHRLSTIINADCIYVVNKGEIVESGTYAELMSQKGMFAMLAERQVL